MSTEKAKILKGAKKAFFAAMLAGYAGNEAGKTKTPDGYTTIEFIDGDYKVVDRYCTTPLSNYSAGTTTIFYKNVPVWWMSYGGFYNEEEIPFLKNALKAAYEAREFIGGRGCRCYKEGDYTYRNIVKPGNFVCFEGRESIVKNGWSEVGVHRYWGMSLL